MDEVDMEQIPEGEMDAPSGRLEGDKVSLRSVESNHQNANRSTPSDLEGNPRKIYIGNIPGHTSADTLHGLFKKYGDITQIDVKGRFAFMTFESPSSADEAVKDMHNQTVMGDRIIVQHHQSLKVRKARGFNKFKMDGQGVRGRNGDYRVILFDLESRVSWQDLKDFGRAAGEVNFSNVYVDHGKKYGIIEYFDIKSCERALRELSNSRLYDKRVKIEQDVGQLNDLIPPYRRRYEHQDRPPPPYDGENGDVHGSYRGVDDMNTEMAPRREGGHRQSSYHPMKDGYSSGSIPVKVKHPYAVPHGTHSPPSSRHPHRGHDYKYASKEDPVGSHRSGGIPHSERSTGGHRYVDTPSPGMDDMDGMRRGSSRERRRRPERHSPSMYKKRHTPRGVMVLDYPPEERHRERLMDDWQHSYVKEKRPPSIHGAHYSSDVRYAERAAPAGVEHSMDADYRYGYRERSRHDDRYIAGAERYGRPHQKLSYEGRHSGREGAYSHVYKDHGRMRSRSREMHPPRYEMYGSR